MTHAVSPDVNLRVRHPRRRPRVGMTLRRLLLTVIVFGWCGVPGALGQVVDAGRSPHAFIDRQRVVEEAARRQYEEQFGTATRGQFDFGGWYNLNFLLFDDGVESSRTLRRHDLRIWGRADLGDGAHQFYARGRISLIDFNAGDSFDRNEDDVDGMNLERGTYRFDLARYARAVGASVPAGNLVIDVGRDLVEVGHGLALSLVLDRASVTLTHGDWEVMGLGGMTVGSAQDVDLSRPVSRTRRTFLGGQVRYLGYERHRPFVYAVWQRDRHGDSVLPLGRDFDFDSFYVGAGARGALTDGLSYAVEVVYQTGDRASQAIFAPKNAVEAWSADVELEYLFDGPKQGRVSAQYLFGSGDSERTLSPVDTVGGVQRDRRDTGFVGFGFRETGLSFAPRISNLHLARVGASVHPFPDDARWRHFEVGTDWYLYYKHHRGGSVSDPTSDRGSGYLGWEMDYFANWRVSADLAYTARFGSFFPGSAFSDRTTRTFALLGVIWSF